jgi:malate synthase
MNDMQTQLERITVLGAESDASRRVLTADALKFITNLSRQFESRRQELLQRRLARQAEIVAGKLPDFLPETEHIRNADWTVAPIPKDLLDRRVEITGPVDRKMIINALNCGANVFMADLEDSNSPTWQNNMDGQVNLQDAVNKTITFSNPDGKQYKLNPKIATLLVRPRGWHLVEKHVLVDGQPISGSISAFTSSTTRKPFLPTAAVHTFTCPNWRAISKLASGTMCSTPPRTRSACRMGRSAQRC